MPPDAHPIPPPPPTLLRSCSNPPYLFNVPSDGLPCCCGNPSCDAFATAVDGFECGMSVVSSKDEIDVDEAGDRFFLTGSSLESTTSQSSLSNKNEMWCYAYLIGIGGVIPFSLLAEAILLLSLPNTSSKLNSLLLLLLFCLANVPLPATL